MKHLEKLTRKRLGEVLVDEGLISKSQLADAEREQKRSGESLGSILVEANYVTDYDLAKTVSSQYQLPYIQLGIFPRSKELAGLFSVEDMVRRRIIPIDRIGQTLTMAVAEMPDLDFLKGVQDRLGAVPFLFVAQLSDIKECLENGQALAVTASTPVPETKKSGGKSSKDEALSPPSGLSSHLPAGGGASKKPLEQEADDLHILGGNHKNGDSTGKGSSLSGKGFLGSKEEGGESWEHIFDAANASILEEMEDS